MSLISEIWNCIRDHFQDGLRDRPYLRLPASFPLPYIDRNNMGGVCWLRLQQSKDHQMVVAIATDLTLRLHTASTVTNSIEIVAAQIVGLLGFLPSEFVNTTISGGCRTVYFLADTPNIFIGLN